MPETRSEAEAAAAAAEAERLKAIVSQAVSQAVTEANAGAQAGMRAAVSAAVADNKEAIPNKFELMPFQGNVTDNFDEWLKWFNRLAQANSWSDDHKKNILPYYLVGSAEQTYDNTTQAERTNYNTLIVALKEKLRPGHPKTDETSLS